METPLTPLEFARRTRRLHGHREGVVDGDLRLTYEQFFDRCDRWSAALQQLGVARGDRVATIAPNTHSQLESFYAVPQIGAVLVPGAKAPKLITDEQVSRMKPGAVLVDIAIDQGGCFEDSRPTTHDEPTYRVHDSVFYCVANMPGAVPYTSTFALTNVTLPYITEIANRGWRDALRADPALARGLSTHDGALTCQPVAAAHGLPFTPAAEVLD